MDNMEIIWGDSGRLESIIYNGNQNDKTRFHWNAANQLTKVELRDGRIVEYDYFISGRLKSRLLKANATDPGIKEEYSDSNMAFDQFTITVNGQIIESYLFGAGTLDEFYIQNQRYVPINNASDSSVRHLVSAPHHLVPQTQQASYAQGFVYGEYGNLLYILGANGQPVIARPLSRFLWKGHFYDFETGLYFSRNNQWYHPQVVRILQGNQSALLPKQPIQPSVSTVRCHDGGQQATPDELEILKRFIDDIKTSKPSPATSQQQSAILNSLLAPEPAPTRNHRVIQSEFGNVIELYGESVMICHGVDRFRNVMVGPPNSFANVPGLERYVQLRDFTARTTFEVAATVAIPGSVGTSTIGRWALNSAIQSTKFAAVHEVFGATVLDQEMDPGRFVVNTATGMFVHGAFRLTGQGIKAVAQSNLSRELVLTAALKNPLVRVGQQGARAPSAYTAPLNPLVPATTAGVRNIVGFGSSNNLRKQLFDLRYAQMQQEIATLQARVQQLHPQLQPKMQGMVTSGAMSTNEGRRLVALGGRELNLGTGKSAGDLPHLLPIEEGVNMPGINALNTSYNFHFEWKTVLSAEQRGLGGRVLVTSWDICERECIYFLTNREVPWIIFGPRVAVNPTNLGIPGRLLRRRRAPNY